MAKHDSAWAKKPIVCSTKPNELQRMCTHGSNKVLMDHRPCMNFATNIDPTWGVMAMTLTLSQLNRLCRLRRVVGCTRGYGEHLGAYMKRLNSKRSLVLGCALAFAAVASAPRTSLAATTTAAKEDASATAKEETRAASVANSWSTRGGAALGSGTALRVGFGASTQNNVNASYLNVDAGLIIAVGQHFDISINLRAPMYHFGVSPGVGLRAELIDDSAFHLSLVANVQVPMIFYPGFWLGLSVEPGFMASYFFSERTELYSGLVFIWSPLFMNPWVPGTGNMGFAGLFRLGLAYTLAAANVGFYGNIDVGAGYEPVRQFILLGNRGSGLAVNLGLTVGTQFKF